MLTVPGSFAVVEGNDSNGFPFNLGLFGLSSQRYQQVYGAGEFPAGPILITGIRFRPDSVIGTAFGPTTLALVQIDLSTTGAPVDGLSLTFASNVGADNTIVFPMGPLTLTSAYTGAVPKDFDVLVPFATPFAYNPLLGNLLLDVRNLTGGFTAQFDAEFGSGDSVSRVFTRASGVGSAAADEGNTYGLVTRFEYTTMPEPGTWLAVGSGMVLLALRRHRQSHRPPLEQPASTQVK
jgi:hypothetical protein